MARVVALRLRERWGGWNSEPPRHQLAPHQRLRAAARPVTARLPDRQLPFILLGASFGGLVAGAYAVAHPDRTAGILLLDSSIPDDYVIDKRHGFDGMCLKANRQADAYQSLEKIDNCRLSKWAYDRRDQEPDVPLIYLAAKDPSDRGDVADDSLRKAFVRRWSTGIWESVSAPHWMDEADPKLVEKNLERVIVLANSGQ